MTVQNTSEYVDHMGQNVSTGPQRAETYLVLSYYDLDYSPEIREVCDNSQPLCRSVFVY